MWAQHIKSPHGGLLCFGTASAAGEPSVNGRLLPQTAVLLQKKIVAESSI
jgi:hypothetical protein